jgi:glycosyltransferase involved in cell wall biosynthesis
MTAGGVPNGAVPVRVAVLCDYLGENWPSMDLTAEMVVSMLRERHAGAVEVERVCPPFRHRLTRWPVVGRSPAAYNADRLLNRFRDYPRVARRLARSGRFDLFHVIDHSYGQLLHELPEGRAVVTCHDLDTFRCLLDPAREPRPRWFRAMTGRILDGLKTAAAVACDSRATLDGLIAYGVVPADRLHLVYLGTNPEFTPAPDAPADAETDRLLGPRPDHADAPPDLLHVGSNIPRKRVDVLLDVFATVRRDRPGARLIKAGGALPPDLERRARSLGVSDAVVTLPYFNPRFPRDRAALAAVYRRAALVLLTSEAEGFGLPVAEALAVGTPLLASDIPVLREVGGSAAEYRPVGDVDAWASAALSLLDERRRSPDAWRARRDAGFARARLFSWSTHADRLASIYRQTLSRCVPAPAHVPGALPASDPSASHPSA